jgi:hypothetical protein
MEQRRLGPDTAGEEDLWDLQALSVRQTSLTLNREMVEFRDVLPRAVLWKLDFG